jgi:hypothetical protein
MIRWPRKIANQKYINAAQMIAFSDAKAAG